MSPTLDLTDRIRELERSNTELEQFAYVASHDLQEPVRTVQTCLEMFVRRYGEQLDEPAMAFLQHAIDASSHMKNLLDDLLAYARIGRGDTPDSPVDLGQMVATALAGLGMAAQDARVDIGDLPTISGNHGELLMVFRNLLGNALKFRSPEREPHIEIHGEIADGRCMVTVSDNGIGIPDDQREAVFEMFRRLHPRSAFPGTGLGLSFCRRVVEGHGGRIWAEESESGGTAIRVDLPALNQEDPR